MAKTKKDKDKVKGTDRLSKKALKKQAELSKDAKKEAKKAAAQSWSDVLGVAKGFLLADLDPRSTPGFSGDKAAGELAMEGLDVTLAELQERLFAESKAGGTRAVLLVVQGMDTSGKGGIMRYVVGSFDPQGVRHTAFKAPSKEELAHDFLWRITNALPKPGEIGVFDRSQYEDVLIVRVHDIVPREVWMKRYAQINAWERKVTASGTKIIKVMLHISKDEQKARLMERLDRPDKYWKFNPGDVDERLRWADYMEAYQAVLAKTSTMGAPWHVVPADRKWYARLAVTNLVLEALQEMDPQWPAATFDVEEQKQRLADS